MRAKTFAEYHIRQYLEVAYPGLGASIKFTGTREAVVTDGNGDQIRLIYEDGEVRRDYV